MIKKTVFTLALKTWLLYFCLLFVSDNLVWSGEPPISTLEFQIYTRTMLNEAAKSVVGTVPEEIETNTIFPSSSESVEYDGAGFIIEKIGANEYLVLLSAHQIGLAKKIFIRTMSGQIYQAEVVGVDPDFSESSSDAVKGWGSDLGLVKFRCQEDLPSLRLSDDVQAGDFVFAIGYPSKYCSFSFGIASSIDAEIRGKENSAIRFIQHSCVPSYFGSSGGPLLNIKGEVVGISLMKEYNTPGIAFAAILNGTVKQIISDLKHYGYAKR